MGEQLPSENLFKRASASAERLAHDLADDLDDFRSPVRMHSRSPSLDPSSRQRGQELLVDAEAAARKIAQLLRTDPELKSSPESST